MTNILKKWVGSWVCFGILVCSTFTFGQSTEPKSLTLFKFYPLPLITNAMSFGVEKMNRAQTRSTSLLVGIRYRRAEETFFNPYLQNNATLDNFNQWQGGFMQWERRFYVPTFKRLDQGTWLDARGSGGVYWAPSLLVDYSVNSFDRSGFETLFPDQSGQPDIRPFVHRGDVRLFSVKPSLVMGVQYTLFEHLYFDMSLGAGLRWLTNTEDVEKTPNQSSGYYSSNLTNATDELLYRAGVRVSGQIAIGVKW